MEFGPQQIGKWLILFGAVIVLVGVVFIVLGRVGLFRLPGDIEFGSKNWRIYLPIGTCVLVSVILMLVLWVIHYFRR